MTPPRSSWFCRRTFHPPLREGYLGLSPRTRGGEKHGHQATRRFQTYLKVDPRRTRGPAFEGDYSASRFQGTPADSIGGTAKTLVSPCFKRAGGISRASWVRSEVISAWFGWRAGPMAGPLHLSERLFYLDQKECAVGAGRAGIKSPFPNGTHAIRTRNQRNVVTNDWAKTSPAQSCKRGRLEGSIKKPPSEAPSNTNTPAHEDQTPSSLARAFSRSENEGGARTTRTARLLSAPR